MDDCVWCHAAVGAILSQQHAYWHAVNNLHRYDCTVYLGYDHCNCGLDHVQQFLPKNLRVRNTDG